MAAFESERVDNEDEMEINLNEISKEDEFQTSALTLESILINIMVFRWPLMSYACDVMRFNY